MPELKIYTTPILDGYKVVEYKGLITAKTVRAMNLFRDIATAFRDMTGGRSESYERLINEMHDDIIEEILAKARAMNVNAILGFSLDFDTISGKNTSLIMGFAKGTACIIEKI